ncbi:MAG: hypothetical protein AAF485_15930 [Chloroflexota bacterium]
MSTERFAHLTHSTLVGLILTQAQRIIELEDELVRLEAQKPIEPTTPKFQPLLLTKMSGRCINANRGPEAKTEK